ncbi:4'-phosphopantetheinyl transferase family protein [Thalassotalea marina]|uniref:4'-phosphopantetheinyl transferase domain-containing protein n=1 Tax=Thalassotalea marina TaxID=1673741 RepID=A0A919BLC0_9GAMM|nr:4'-phosphopantetheinyl transferase superfamily protein [Thalassotalea marina]GHF97058.1 hypothetical protein GCM10017161_26460 [Thalassotalea marina]
MQNKPIYVAVSTKAAKFALDKSALQANELAQFSTKTSNKAQRQFLASRGFIKHVVAKHLGCGLQAVAVFFDTNTSVLNITVEGELFAYGALSHSNDAVAVIFAVGQHFTIGIDIELINRKRGVEALAVSCLTADEVNHVLHSSDAFSAFYQAWTLKEALSKATKISLTKLFSLESEALLTANNLVSQHLLQDNYICTCVLPAENQLTFIELSNCHEN